jgi:hypothetical protein
MFRAGLYYPGPRLCRVLEREWVMVKKCSCLPYMCPCAELWTRHDRQLGLVEDHKTHLALRAFPRYNRCRLRAIGSVGRADFACW